MLSSKVKFVKIIAKFDLKNLHRWWTLNAQIKDEAKTSSSKCVRLYLI